jgi:hypothetical protein
MTVERARLSTFVEVLLEEIRENRPDLLKARFTVAEVYQVLVPYRTHKDRLGLEIIGDYDEVILRLLVGEGDYLRLEPASVRERLATEMEARNPNPGIFRTFAAAEVHLGPGAQMLLGGGATRPGPASSGGAPPASTPGRAPVSRSMSALSETPPPVAAPSAPLAPPASNGPSVTPSSASFPAPRRGEMAPRPAEPVVTKAPRPCRACTRDLPAHPNLAFCPYCGTSVVPPACPRCDGPLQPEWRFCVQCGERTGAP